MNARRGVQAVGLMVVSASLICLVVLANGSTTEARASTPLIGVIGCSNSRDAVRGYELDGGTHFWQLGPGLYSGGTVVAWAANNLNNTYWAEFESLLSQHPGTTQIWWSLCTFSTETNAQNQQAALAVVAKVHQLVPGAVIHVSAINGYVAPHVCSLLGALGPSRMQALANALVRQGTASPGPKVGSLISIAPPPSEGATPSNNQTDIDGCHPNTPGSEYLGQALKSFFG